MTTAGARPVDVVYSPGSLYLVVGSSSLSLTSDVELARRLWPIIRTGGGFDALLDETVSTGLSRLADLVLFGYTSTESRVLIRGPHVVVAEHDNGSTTRIDGAAVTTWVERGLVGVQSLTVGEISADALPLVVGAARSGAVVWRWSTAAVDSVVPEFLPVATTGGAASAVAGPEAAPFPAAARPPSTSFPAVVTAPVLTTAPVPAIVPSPASAPAADAVATPPALIDHVPEAILVTGAAAVAPPPPTADDMARGERTKVAGDEFEGPPQSDMTRPPDLDPSDIRPSIGPVDPFEETSMPAHLSAPAGIPAMITDVPRPAGRNGSPRTPAPGVSVGSPVFAGPAEAEHDGHTIVGTDLEVVLAAARERSERPVEPVEHALLVVSTGQQVSTERPVILGRRPSAERVSGAQIPQLVTVPSADLDISRSHLEIRSSAAGFTATDLHSTNGSMLRRAGGSTAAIEGGRSVLVQVGDVIDLGDGITVEIRELR